MTQSKAFAILIEIDINSSLKFIVERRNAGPTTKNKMAAFSVE